MYFIMKCIAVVLLLIRASYTDITRGKIENKVLQIFILIGGAMLLVHGGYRELLQGMKMAVIITAVLLVLYLKKALGAGDIKLLAVIALYFPDYSIPIVVSAFIAAGVLSVLRMIGRAVRREKVLVAGETIHFSIPIAIATVIVVAASIFL